MDGMSALAIASMLWFGASRIGVPESAVTLGLLVAFIDYLGMLFGPIREFSGRIATVQRAVAALERIADLLDADDRITPGSQSAEGLRGTLVFEDVHFRYDESRPDVLCGVSLALQPGEVVALVGATTLVSVVLWALLTRGHVLLWARLARGREGRTLRETTPRGDHQSNGAAEQAVRTARAHSRSGGSASL